MATRLIDIKLKFEAFNCTPGFAAWERYEAQLFGHGGTADDHGWSFADVFQGLDDGGVGGDVIPAAPANADDRARARLRRKRLKGANTYLVKHLSNAFWVDKLSKPPFLGDGHTAFVTLRAHCRTPPDTTDTDDLCQD